MARARYKLEVIASADALERQQSINHSPSAWRTLTPTVDVAHTYSLPGTSGAVAVNMGDVGTASLVFLAHLSGDPVLVKLNGQATGVYLAAGGVMLFESTSITGITLEVTAATGAMVRVYAGGVE